MAKIASIFRCLAASLGSMTGGFFRGVVFVLKNGLHWRDVPVEYGPPKSLYNRFIRSSRMDVFNVSIRRAPPSLGIRPCSPDGYEENQGITSRESTLDVAHFVGSAG